MYKKNLRTFYVSILYKSVVLCSLVCRALIYASGPAAGEVDFVNAVPSGRRIHIAYQSTAEFPPESTEQSHTTCLTHVEINAIEWTVDLWKCQRVPIAKLLHDDMVMLLRKRRDTKSAHIISPKLSAKLEVSIMDYQRYRTPQWVKAECIWARQVERDVVKEGDDVFPGKRVFFISNEPGWHCGSCSVS
mgnify:CR=1 FL=1